MASKMNTSLLRAPRFPLRMPLQYQKSGGSQWYEGETLNISRTGILFHTDGSVTKDSTLDIRVEFPGKVTFRCQGSVVRVEDAAIAVRIHRYSLSRCDEKKAATNFTH